MQDLGPTVLEFCRSARISRSLCYRLIKAGKLPVLRLSPRNIRVNVEALRAEMAAGDRASSTGERK